MANKVFHQIKGTGFDLNKEGEHGDLAGYFGIDLGKEADGSIHMTQTSSYMFSATARTVSTTASGRLPQAPDGFN